ncbi:MAG: NUDIX domain-containing protein [Succinivibrio sp.]
MSSTELVDIVDRDNNVLRTVTRAQMRKEQLPHRASYIAVLNQQGKYLVEIRTLSKDYSPGTFDAVVGGVMQHGEDYLASAKRELLEEVGIDADTGSASFYELGTLCIEDKAADHFFFGYLYLCITDCITTRQESEVSGVMFLDEKNVLLQESNCNYDSVAAFKEILKRAREKKIID